MPKHFIFDVESIGLLGEAFAFGAVLGEIKQGEFIETQSWLHSCSKDTAVGFGSAESVAADHKWLSQNVPELKITCSTPFELRTQFAKILRGLLPPHDAASTRFWCDWSHPVDVPFVRDVMRQEGWISIPGIDDINTLIRMVRLPALNRLHIEHDPLADARHSARRLAAGWTEVIRLKKLSCEKGAPS